MRLTLTCLELRLSENARHTAKPLVHGRVEAQEQHSRTCHCAATEPLGRWASVAMWL